ncbi:MAG: hypothetical protein N4A57_17415 [Anaeromicrobium sp.]|jgi:hypothetical protein|nr:hypothetical protein [Anaeromicrobium sp.]
MNNDKEFRLFLNGIWKYQWVRKETKLTDEITNLIYEKTQGISDLIVKLLVNSQYKAISIGKEELTSELIEKVADEEFRLMKPMLAAIRSKNPYKIMQYEDIRRIEEVGNIIVPKDQIRPSINRRTIVKENKIDKKQEINIEQTVKTKTRNKKIKVEDLPQDDIRVLVNEGVKKNLTVHVVFVSNGLIDNLEFLEVGDIN